MSTIPAAAADFDTFCAMIQVSWTYDKMTDDEQTRCMEALRGALEHGAIKGSPKSRRQILHAIYLAFLLGLGYDGPRWRYLEDSDAPLF